MKADRTLTINFSERGALVLALELEKYRDTPESRDWENSILLQNFLSTLYVFNAEESNL